jgi:Dolichyl-phosphate-mannose-protein mannosyltransferase/Alg9-like mannosyltransferase family
VSKLFAFADRFLFTVKSKPSILIFSLLLLFAGAFLVRVWGLSYLHYWDEMVYLQNAKVICCGKTNYSELQFRPPLLSLLFAGAFLIRDHIFAASIVTAALNALGPVLLFLSGRRIVGALPSALASLLLAFGPFFVGVFPAGFDSDDTGNSLLTDSPALTLVLLGLWLMLRALEKQKLSRFALAGFGISLAILIRFGSIPSVGLLCLLPMMAKDRWRALAATGAGFMAGLGPYLLWSRIAYGGYFETLREGWKNVEGPEPPFTFYLANSPTIFTWIGVLGLLLAAGAGLVILFKSLRRKPIRAADFTISVSPEVLQGFLWLWLLIDFVFFSQMPHKEPRYVMPLAPPLLLLSGSGLALFCRLPGKLLRPIGVLLLTAGMVVTLLPSASRLTDRFVVPDHPEEMEASIFLESRYPPATPLYMNFNYPAFAYFTNFGINVLPIGGPELYRAIDEMPESGILIAYRKNESGDPKIEVLNHDPSLEVVKEYSTLVIYRRLKDSK